MADNHDAGAVPIPPKLDLRKSGIMRQQPSPTVPVQQPSPTVPVQQPAPPLPVQQVAGPVAQASSTVPPAENKAAAQAQGSRPVFGVKAPPQPIRIDGLGTTAAAAKRETSRISLEAARAPNAGGAPLGNVGGPKTIRLKPGGSTMAPKVIPKIVPGVAVVPPVAPGAPVSAVGPLSATSAGAGPEPGVTAKRTTSRISLDTVLGAADAAVTQPGGPKTIRLKRPGEASAGKLSPDTSAAVTDAAAAATTQKKTVRIKRPSEAADPQAVSQPEGTKDSGPAMPVVNHEPHFLFPVFAVISMLVVAVLIYVLLAQCLGPDSSLTQISMGVSDVDLPWPGKLAGH